MSERYGRKGFSQTKAVRGILDQYEKPRRSGNSRRVRFEGLPAPEAANLLVKLPEAQQHDTASSEAPSFATLVEAGLQVSGAVFAGFRIDSSDPSERITLTRITVPSGARTKEVLDTLVAELPDHQRRLQIGGDGAAYIDWETTRDN